MFDWRSVISSRTHTFARALSLASTSKQADRCPGQQLITALSVENAAAQLMEQFRFLLGSCGETLIQQLHPGFKCGDNLIYCLLDMLLLIYCRRIGINF